MAAQLSACCMLELCSESVCRARFFQGFTHEKTKKFYFESPADLFPTLSDHNKEKRPQCFYSQAIKFCVKLNPRHLRASVDQVLICIFPRPHKLSAMDQEISSGIIHSALVLCTTKAATASLQLPYSFAT